MLRPLRPAAVPSVAAVPSAAALLLAATLLLVAGGVTGACKRDDPAPCGELSAAERAAATAPAAEAAPAAPDVAEAPSGELPGTAAFRTVDDPRVRLAVETANDLFHGRHAAVTARLEGPLQGELDATALRGLVAGVVNAHGEPARIVDAWPGEIMEEGRPWTVASVLLRMSRSDARFRLLLVFNPDGTVRGLWLRPM